MVRSLISTIILAALVVAFLTGCATFGPATVARDRFEYTDAISESWKRQMLWMLAPNQSYSLSTNQLGNFCIAALNLYRKYDGILEAW